MIMRFLLFAFGLLCLPSTCALVGVVGAFSRNADTYTTTWRKSSSKTRLLARRPVIVAGGAGSSAAVAQAALGADLALSAREFVDGANNSVRNSGAVSSVLVVQNADDGEYPSIEQYEDAICQFDDDIGTKPILHVILEGSAAARPLLSPSIANDIAFLGIEPIVPKQARKMDKVLPEVAQRCGCMLQEIVDAFGGRESQPSMAIMLDLPLHLSMLQANSLPKSMSAHEDSFLCRDTQNTYLVDYQYNYNDPFGGTDPLLCPSREITISAAGNVKVGTGNGFASAAAYTALRGNGVHKIPAACIASSVQAVIDEGTRHDVSRIAKLAEEVENAAIEQPVMRSRYIEFGYK